MGLVFNKETKLVKVKCDKLENVFSDESISINSSSDEIYQFIQLLKKKGWKFNVLGKATSPTYSNSQLSFEEQSYNFNQEFIKAIKIDCPPPPPPRVR